MVSAPTVGPALEEGRAAAPAGVLDGVCRRSVDRDHVVSVDRRRRDPEDRRARSDALAGGDGIRRRELGVTVVLADEEDRCLPESREIQRLEEHTLVRRAVSEESDRNRAAAQRLRREGESDGMGDPSADDAVCADRALGGSAYVHRPALAPAISSFAPEDLGEHAARLEPAGQHVVVATMRGSDLVAANERRAHPDGDRFLAD